MDKFVSLVRAFNQTPVRFLVIGVWGANYYAHSGATLFTTQDRDLFLPLEARNLTTAWAICESEGLSIWSAGELLDRPHDEELPKRVVQHRATTRASDGAGLDVDLSLVMEGFAFDAVWAERRTFVVDEVAIPVARLAHIVASKAAVGREKDRLFLATHAQALEDLLPKDENE